jgi:hypothetical protein
VLFLRDTEALFKWLFAKENENGSVNDPNAIAESGAPNVKCDYGGVFTNADTG